MSGCRSAAGGPRLVVVQAEPSKLPRRNPGAWPSTASWLIERLRHFAWLAIQACPDSCSFLERSIFCFYSPHIIPRIVPMRMAINLSKIFLHAQKKLGPIFHFNDNGTRIRRDSRLQNHFLREKEFIPGKGKMMLIYFIRVLTVRHWIVFPPNSYVEALTPRTSEGALIWKVGLLQT